jgi:hypothetical protein
VAWVSCPYDIDALHAEFVAKCYPNLHPAVETIPWGTRDVAITDPFGNRLIFKDGSG